MARRMPVQRVRRYARPEDTPAAGPRAVESREAEVPAAGADDDLIGDLPEPEPEPRKRKRTKK